MVATLCPTGESGETGRRAGFRILYLNRCGGSTPPSRNFAEQLFFNAAVFQYGAITPRGCSTRSYVILSANLAGMCMNF